MKTVYFVRHGESEANVNLHTGKGIFQGEASPLSDAGQKQAEFIAGRCKNLPIDVILASPARRAHDTASKIQQATGKPLEIHDFLTERKPPSEILGHSRSDPAMKEVLSRWHQTFYVEGARVGDGENFEDLKTRVQSVLQFLADRAEDHIVVATHGFLLHMVLSVVLLGETLTVEEFRRAARKMWMNNTGITQIEYFMREDNKRLDDNFYEGWVLRVWNDHAHLG